MRSRQLGQSMTEYLVVLGVTGAVLVATLTDVENIFDAVHDNYATQSREMNRVQLYDSHRVRYSEVVPGEDYDDGSTEGSQPDIELPVASLPTGIFDELGNLIGIQDGDRYVDKNGETVATCDLTGLCVDGNGNPVSATPIDAGGNALTLQALYDAQGNLLGFAYYHNGGYYHPGSYRPMTLPSGVTVDKREPSNTLYVGDSKQPAGFESRGKIYGLASVYAQTDLRAGGLNASAEQLLSVAYATPPAGWENLSPCVVMSNAQMADIEIISVGSLSTPVATLGNSGKRALADPASLRHVKTTASACNAAKQATLYPGGHWVVSDK
ncbi:hypothetical protein [Pseudomonas saudiphocaensis]|uniref:Uncharacterized protein n=1 Tax=Pseudomonas saudiphocaensis TaxID=1499686 RepID=A0A078LWD1_9PSED|nr:hypothetical protein [Pseudomonas saudiphocaensis]CDZ95494.1 hypothetical protein BN1079_02829 [Pseudomonas saudiphocaensis]